MTVDYRYRDILTRPRPHFLKRPLMRAGDRAAQFSPFAALTGYEDAVRETARLTEPFTETDETVRESLNAKLIFLSARLRESPAVTMKLFQPDVRKAGGSYVYITGCIRQIDPNAQLILLTDGQRIPMEYLREIESECFSGIFD